MKKDTIYSMRISRTTRDALKKTASRERRTVASLLDKIITDYLEKEGFSVREETNEERRRFPRKKITLPGITVLKSNEMTDPLPGVILDLSMGGVLLTYPKGSDLNITSVGELPVFELRFLLPSVGEQINFDCHARRISDTGNEIQIGAVFKDPEENVARKLKAYLS